MPDKIKVRIRTTELINPDGSVELQPDTVVANTTGDAAFKAALQALQANTSAEANRNATKRARSFTELRDQKDNPYTDMQFPTVE